MKRRSFFKSITGSIAAIALASAVEVFGVADKVMPLKGFDPYEWNGDIIWKNVKDPGPIVWHNLNGKPMTPEEVAEVWRTIKIRSLPL